jgi:AcrR family transcriptional regulator
MNKREQQKEHTRRKIFNCAIRLFMEHSYDTVKIKDITKAAQVSVGAFYYHFPSKENLIDEGYRLFDEELILAFERDRPASGIDTIEYIIYSQLQDVKHKGVEITAVFFKNQLGIIKPYLFDRERFFYTKLCENVDLVNQSEYPTDVIVDSFLRATRGTIYDWCLHNNSYDVVAMGMSELRILIDHYRLI